MMWGMDLHPLTAAVAGAYAAARAGRGRLGLGEVLDAVSALQAARNVLDACEAELLAQAGAIELLPEEDGTTREVHHVVGHQEMDAPELVAPRLGVSVHVAASRLSRAVSLVTRTPQLLEEMAAGRLDGFRARVVAEELDDAPAAVAATVVAELIARAEQVGGWRESAGPLRRRTASTLTRVDASLARVRAERERARRGLTRRVESSSLDAWEGCYPVEDARRAWDAIDTLARRIHADGHTDTLTQARADAHLQLLLGQVTTVIHLHPAIAAAGVMPAAATPPRDTDPTHCAAPTTSVTSAVPTIAPVRTPAALPFTDAVPTTAPGLGVDGEGVVELSGFGGTGSCTIPARWLAAALTDGSAVLAAPITCHPDTGAALTTPTGEEAGVEEHYRPSTRLRAQIGLRDAGCRFPGCTIAYRFCDLDHVRPWPTGPTAPDNLIALCRRHHRLKQRPGWRVHLDPDGTTHWWAPDGQHHTTAPIDHLATTRTPLNAPAGREQPPAEEKGTDQQPPDQQAPGQVNPPGAPARSRPVEFDDPYGIRHHSPLVEHYTRALLDHNALDRPLTRTEGTAWHAREQAELRALNGTPLVTIAGLPFSRRRVHHQLTTPGCRTTVDICTHLPDWDGPPF